MLLLKVLLAPMLVVGSSLAGRRWGAQVAGVFVALPIVAGPILLITCLEQGARFGARAAAAALLGLVSLALFAVVFSWCSRKCGWLGSLGIAWSACLLADVGLARVTVPPGWGLILVLATAWASAKMFPAVAGDDPPSDAAGGAPAWPWWDLPARAGATAVLVLAITAAASTVGPGLTGVLAPFPIATSVVAVFVLAQHGSAGAVRTLRGVPRGLLGFSVFCFVVAVLVVPAGVFTAFGLASAATLAVQLGYRTAQAQWQDRRRNTAGATGQASAE